MKKRFNSKGSVLLTVVCVMAVLSIVLMTAIVSVSSSNQKTLRTYTDEQAYVTGKSVVDLFSDCLMDETTADFDSIKQSIVNLAVSKSINIPVTLPSEVKGDLPVGADGKQYITVTRTSDKDFKMTADVKDVKSTVSVSRKFSYNDPITVVSEVGQGTTKNLNYLSNNSQIRSSTYGAETATQKTVSAIPVKTNRPSGWPWYDNNWPGAKGTLEDNTWTANFQKYSSDIMTYFSKKPNFLWEDCSGRNMNYYKKNYYGDIVKFEFTFDFNGKIDDSKGATDPSKGDAIFRCAADDAWIGYINGNYLGYANIVKIKNKSVATPATPDDKKIVDLFGDLSWDYLQWNDSDWGSTGRIISIKNSQLVQGKNTIVIYAANHTGSHLLPSSPSDTSINPTCLLFGMEIKNIQSYDDPSTETHFSGKYTAGEYVKK